MSTTAARNDDYRPTTTPSAKALITLLVEAAEEGDKQLWDCLCIGAITSPDGDSWTADEIEQLVWQRVHPRLSLPAKARLVAWRCGSEQALAQWVEDVHSQCAAVLIKAGHDPGVGWSRAPGPLLVMTPQAMDALEDRLLADLPDDAAGTDPLALIRPWLKVSR